MTIIRGFPLINKYKIRGFPPLYGKSTCLPCVWVTISKFFKIWRFSDILMPMVMPMVKTCIGRKLVTSGVQILIVEVYL